MSDTPLLSPPFPPITVSFEFFPPKTERMAEQLWDAIRRLEPLAPSFVSVTYGAGGSTRERTHDTVMRILHETELKPAAHLTCVCHSRAEIAEIATRYWDEGVRHIVALRGDPPDGQTPYTCPDDGYDYAVDLVAGLKSIADFEISVAAYPEVHPDAPSAQFDLDNLKRKVDAGASRAITQVFFEVDVFKRFRDKAQAAGIDIPIIPGIMPITSYSQIERFSRHPERLKHLFEGLDDDPETRRLISATYAAEQVRALTDAGVDQFHFYTLNKADLTYAICHLLGVRPKKETTS